MKTILPLMLIALFCSPLTAQTAHQAQQVQRVDQAVGDLDGLSRSMRQQGGGLRLDGEHTSLYTIPAEKIQQLQVFGQAAQTTGVQHTNAYLRVAPGLAAQSDQTNYLVGHRTNATGLASNVAPAYDGAFYEKIPANTVFILSPQLQDLVHEANTNQQQSTPVEPNRVMPKRVDNRVADRMVDNRVDNRCQAQRVDNRVSNTPYQTTHYRVQEARKQTQPTNATTNN
jgi:hypothetical protein